MKTSILAGASLLAVGAAFVAAPQHAHAAANRPMYMVQPLPRAASTRALASTLPTFTFTYNYNGASGSEVFVGNEPTAGAAATIPVILIPIKTVYTDKNGNTTTEDPLATMSGSRNVMQSIEASPIFQNLDYKQGGTDVGNTQYEDAFQRASLWYGVSGNSGYHVLLKAKLYKEVTFTVPTSDGSVQTDFGAHVVQAYVNWWDTQIQKLLKSHRVPTGVLPMFIASNVYLTQTPTSLCCIGGYHSFTGTNTYGFSTYVTTPGAFAQDVSALTHELGEWVQDPYTNNTGCGGLWETGDPLEGEANYGGYPYALNGFTYNLQDLVMPPYFGAAPSTSVNGWSTFQGTSLSVCQNGQ